MVWKIEVRWRHSVVQYTFPITSLLAFFMFAKVKLLLHLLPMAVQPQHLTDVVVETANDIHENITFWLPFFF